MNKQKGITLISLIIYILALTIIISTLSIISDNFFNNMKYVTNKGKYISEFNKFNMYFLEDAKENSDVLQISDDNTEIVFENGTKYTFKNNSIYRNKVKICKNIESCTFEKNTTSETGIEKNIIEVKMYIKGLEQETDTSTDLETSINYVLKYW